MRQLTDGGDNAEAYFSFDGTMLTFQSNEKWGNECDQIMFNWDTDTILENEPPMISNGLGVRRVRTSYPATQPSSTLQHYRRRCVSKGYLKEVGGACVWPIYEDFDIYVSDLEGNSTP